jgi:asparagine synthetase B (glutamine-hydrolysing)
MRLPNRLSDLVAVCPRDALMLPRLRERLPRDPGWHELETPDGWLAVSRGLGEGEVPETQPFVLEGWPDLHRWRGDAERGHAELRRLADARRWSATPGDVSYVQLGPGGTATLVRAPAARVPIYVHRTDEAMFVATRMDLMLALRPEWPWRFDGLVTLSHAGAQGVLPPGRTTIQDVQHVPCGHVLEISRDGASRGRLSRYWDPRPETLRRRFDERAHAAALREAVLEYLEVELDPDGQNLLSLSAGVDSSTLATVTGATLGIGYSAVSILPANPIDRATEDRCLAAIAAVAPPRWHARYHHDEHAWIDVMGDGDAAAGVPVIHPVLLEAPALHRAHGFAVLFGGEWADATCGDRMTISDWLAEAPVRSLLRHQARLPVGERDVLHALRRRALRQLPLEAQAISPGEAPACATPELRREFAAWDEQVLARARAERRPRLRLWQETHVEYWMQQNWEVLSRLDVRRVAPFFQRRVIELAFAAPPQALIGPHVKKPLRRAFAADVPRAVLWREKSVWPNEAAPEPRSWTRDLPEELSAIVRDDWLPRPRAELAFGDRLAVATLESYAMGLRALRSKTSCT